MNGVEKAVNGVTALGTIIMHIVFSETGCGFCSSNVINLKFSFALKQLKAQSLEFKQIFYSSFRCPNLVLNFFELFELNTSDPV